MLSVSSENAPPMGHDVVIVKRATQGHMVVNCARTAKPLTQPLVDMRLVPAKKSTVAVDQITIHRDRPVLIHRRRRVAQRTSHRSRCEPQRASARP